MTLKEIVELDEAVSFDYICNEEIVVVAGLYRERYAILSFEYQVTDEIDFILIINIRFPC